MNAMPALMSGTFSPYCSVMRVFNMGFFRVAADYRVSAPMRPMNFVWRPFVGIPPHAFSQLPFANVRTAIHVQHLPGNVRSFGQINYGIHNFLNVRNASHRG